MGSIVVAKSRKQEKLDGENAIIERMNKALEEMMHTPHETQQEMVERRRRQGKARPAKKSSD
jgi:hypothetical protein